MSEVKRFHDGYTDTLVNDPDVLIRLLFDLRNEKKVEFDTLVGTGMSGVVLLKSAADALSVNWLAIRKPSDLEGGSHASNVLLGKLGKKWLFVDDFISSGRTLFRVLETVNNAAIEYDLETEFVGHVGYSMSWDWWHSRESLIERYERWARDGVNELLGTSNRYATTVRLIKSSVHKHKHKRQGNRSRSPVYATFERIVD